MAAVDQCREQVEEIQELNRLFLSYLRKRFQQDSSGLGLAAAPRRAVLEASSSQLDAAAKFPRALFRLRLERWTPWQVNDPRPVIVEPSGQALQVTLLVSAWNVSRRDFQAARFFLGLDQMEVRRLRATPLADLHRQALNAAAVDCAFADRQWLWTKLLLETRPEYRSRLLLVGLQPDMTDGESLPRRGQSVLS